MQLYITYFQQIRNITDDSCILLDTSVWAPKWLDPSNGKRQYINENNLLIGIKCEEFLMTEDEIPEEMCSGKPCPYISKHPECQFLQAYWAHLCKLDFDKLLSEFERVAEDVRKITHYKGEPKIVLLVHEKPDNLCSERIGLVRLFKEHGLELKEYSPIEQNSLFIV